MIEIFGFCFSNSEIIGFKIFVSDSEPQVEKLITVLFSIFEHPFKNNKQNNNLKDGTLCFKNDEVTYEKIDLERKKMLNKTAKALYDKDITL